MEIFSNCWENDFKTELFIEASKTLGLGQASDGSGALSQKEINKLFKYGKHDQEADQFCSKDNTGKCATGLMIVSQAVASQWPVVIEGVEDPYAPVYISDSYTDLVFSVNSLGIIVVMYRFDVH